VNKIFISYTHGDMPQVKELRELLENSAHSLWVDSEELRGGVDWRLKAREAIVEADAVMLLLSPQALQSEAVAFERGEAERLRKRVFPVIVKPVALPIPGFDPDLVYRDLTNETTYRKVFSQIVGDVQELWSEVRSDLAGLTLGRARDRRIPKELINAVNRVHQVATAAGRIVRPPEAFEAFVELIALLSGDVQQGRPLEDLLTKLLDGRYPPDEWRFRPVLVEHLEFFAEILGPLEKELTQNRTQPIPVVLLVMTAAEARELQSGAAFDDQPGGLRDAFQEIRDGLAQRLETDWVARYRDRPQDWTPYVPADGGTASDSIAEIIRHKLRELGAEPKTLVPRFIDIRSLNDRAKRALLRELREDGCVVVMDLLSICHPTIHEAYRRSLLDSYKDTLLVQVSSFGQIPELTELTLTIRHRLDLEFWNRYDLDSDPKCLQVSNRIQLERVIVNDMPTILPAAKRPQQATTILSYIR
jgi:TIR domain